MRKESNRVKKNDGKYVSETLETVEYIDELHGIPVIYYDKKQKVKHMRNLVSVGIKKQNIWFAIDNYIFNGLSFQEIADKKQVSKMAVCKWHKQGIDLILKNNKLKSYLDDIKLEFRDSLIDTVCRLPLNLKSEIEFVDKSKRPSKLWSWSRTHRDQLNPPLTYASKIKNELPEYRNYIRQCWIGNKIPCYDDRKNSGIEQIQLSDRSVMNNPVNRINVKYVPNNIKKARAGVINARFDNGIYSVRDIVSMACNL